jgi:hypothetical protein
MCLTRGVFCGILGNQVNYLQLFDTNLHHGEISNGMV